MNEDLAVTDLSGRGGLYDGLDNPLNQVVADLFFQEGRMLKRMEVEAFRKATDWPLEFSLVGRAQVIIDLSQVQPADRLPYLRSVLGRI